jgi:hypothetical protein
VRSRLAPTDQGAGLISSIAGVTVFLAFMLFAVQLLVNLYTTTTVTDATHEGARVVASRQVDHSNPAAVAQAQEQAAGQIRESLGPLGDDAELDWSASTPSEVAVRVRVRSPRFLVPGLQGALGLDTVDRTVRVRVEEPR